MFLDAFVLTLGLSLVGVYIPSNFHTGRITDVPEAARERFRAIIPGQQKQFLKAQGLRLFIPTHEIVVFRGEYKPLDDACNFAVEPTRLVRGDALPENVTFRSCSKVWRDGGQDIFIYDIDVQNGLAGVARIGSSYFWGEFDTYSIEERMALIEQAIELWDTDDPEEFISTARRLLDEGDPHFVYGLPLALRGRMVRTKPANADAYARLMLEAVDLSPVATVEEKRLIYWTILNDRVSSRVIAQATKDEAQRRYDALPPRPPTLPPATEAGRRLLESAQKANEKRQADIERRLREARSGINVRPPTPDMRLVPNKNESNESGVER